MKNSFSEMQKKKKPWLWVILAVVLAAVVVLAVWLWPSKITTEVSSELDTWLLSTLREELHTDHTTGKYPAVTYTPLGVEKKGSTTTIYGVMMYCEYTCTTHGELRDWGSANMPFAITAKQTDDGYELVECWWPKNGQEYVSSIEEKFPKQVRDDAVDAQQYFSAHNAICRAQAAANIADADKYVVLQSEEHNVRLAYCPNNTCAYVAFSGGYNTDGAYAREGETKVVFTFGANKVAFAIDGDAYVYTEAGSSDLPEEWKQAGDVSYFVDGVRFTFEDGSNPIPDTKEETAPVGPTVTVSSAGWMNEQELRQLFGEYMVSNFPYDSADLHYLPVLTIKYRNDLDALLAAYKDDPQWSNLKVEDFAQYDEAFFKDNYLMMTYYKDGSISSVPKVSSYVFAEDGAWLSVRLQVENAGGDAALGQWLLFSGIAKEDHKRFTNGIEAYVEKTVTVDAAASDFTLIGTVKEVDGRAMLLECEGNSQFTTVWVELGDAELDPMVGETYIVTYEDVVMPSLPPRITAITVTPKS